MGDLDVLTTSIIENFGTHCPVIDLDTVERNIARA